MMNPQQRRAVSLRISVTDRCQLRCVYCMPLEGVPKLPRGDILSFEEIVRFVRAMQSGFDLLKVHITGGEPLVRRGIVKLVASLAALRIPDLALTTNGQLLAGSALDLKHAGLQRVTISLDSINNQTYQTIMRGGDLQRTLAGIKGALQAELAPVKINVVVMRGLNDNEVTDIAHFGLAQGCQVRFLELMPIGCARAQFRNRFVSSAEVHQRLASSFRLTPMDHDARRSSRNFLAVGERGVSGTIGLISSESHPFCAGCTRLRLTSTGQLIACLAHDESMAIREFLQTDTPQAVNALRELAIRQVDSKCFRTVFDTARAMASVGG